jgi:hypothetical protein
MNEERTTEERTPAADHASGLPGSTLSPACCQARSVLLFAAERRCCILISSVEVLLYVTRETPSRAGYKSRPRKI